MRIGDVTVDDGDHYVPPERRRIGYVPQEGALFPHLTVIANVGFGLPRREPAGAAVQRLIGWSVSAASSTAIRTSSRVANSNGSRWHGP